MGRKVKQSEKVIQISVGFFKRQREFFKAYPEFNVSKLCRDMVDEQIKLIDEDYLEKFGEEYVEEYKDYGQESQKEVENE